MAMVENKKLDEEIHSNLPRISFENSILENLPTEDKVFLYVKVTQHLRNELFEELSGVICSEIYI
jgi:hypothetical protein